MSKSITILGCGYLGSALADICLEKGWQVSALTRNPNTSSQLEARGLHKVVQANLQDENWHVELDSVQDFVVNCVGASSPDADGYIQSYVDGQDSVVKWLANGKVNSLVFTSSCSVYPQTGKRLVDETASCNGVSEKGGLLLAAEQKCFPPPQTVRRSFILRLAGLYGPGRHLLLNKVKSSEQFDGNADRVLNLIHRDDAVNAVLSCLEADDSNIGRIYNVSDGSHASRGQIANWLAHQSNSSEPTFKEDDEEGTPNRKISNNRILDELSWAPRFTNFQLGYENIFNSDS